jgi:hypothetical protein
VSDEHRQTIALLGEGLSVEEQTYETCPECGRDRKLSLKRTDSGLLYCCLRATCGFKGFVGNVLGGAEPRAGRKDTPRRARPFEGRLQPLTPAQAAWFWERFEIAPRAAEGYGVRYAPEQGAFSFEVREARGYGRGTVLRYYDGSEPKTVAYPEHPDKPWQAWYARRHPIRRQRIILVEDQVSAMKAASYMPAVALLGTNLSTAGALEISAVQPSEVIIALDYDATEQAFRIAAAFDLMFKSMRVLPLEKDVKDTPHTELREILSCDGPRSEQE